MRVMWQCLRFVGRICCRIEYGVFLILVCTAAAQGQNTEARLTGNIVMLPAVKFGADYYRVELEMINTGEGVEFTLKTASLVNETSVSDPSIFDEEKLEIPRINVDGVFFEAELTRVGSEPLRLRLTDASTIEGSGNSSPPDQTCKPDPDRTNGPDNPEIVDGWSVSTQFLRDGGPAPDGIPPLDNPRFHSDKSQAPLAPDQLVVGVKIGDETRAYPHNILDWHEIVNDTFQVNGNPQNVILSYCPLTGSAVLWDAFEEASDPTFGTSGLLLNSNLILYDRETGSYWSQMLEQAINGPEILTVPDKRKVVETTWQAWSSMYPRTKVMSRDTGFTRNYSSYPYGSFRTDSSLLFSVNSSGDSRLHRKARVAGITVGNQARAYPIQEFGSGVNVVNDNVGGTPVVAAGSEDHKFGVIYNRRLEDCTVLEFEAVENQLPVIMEDQEGNRWDIFGRAQSGPRAGQQLGKTNSYVAFWFAWAAFFPHTDIHRQGL